MGSSGIPGPPDPAPFVGVTVLVIDDDELTLDATRALLESLGVKVLLARNGAAGLDLLTTVVPDLILCDLQMPRLDGFGFLAQLRRQPGLRRVPVVAITGLASTADMLRSGEAGFRGHLVKPVDEEELLELLQVLL
jgi:CheY-like chemotaxis protein